VGSHSALALKAQFASCYLVASHLSIVLTLTLTGSRSSKPTPFKPPHRHHTTHTNHQGELLRDIGLLVGEFGALDVGDNGISNSDTTQYPPKDKAWLKLLGKYLNSLSWQNGPASWVFWSWNVSRRVGLPAGGAGWLAGGCVAGWLDGYLNGCLLNGCLRD